MKKQTLWINLYQPLLRRHQGQADPLFKIMEHHRGVVSSRPVRRYCTKLDVDWSKPPNVRY